MGSSVNKNLWIKRIYAQQLKAFVEKYDADGVGGGDVASAAFKLFFEQPEDRQLELIEYVQSVGVKLRRAAQGTKQDETEVDEAVSVAENAPGDESARPRKKRRNRATG